MRRICSWATTTEVSDRYPLRVYYEDTDATGVVYHANYLKYFERARTEWLEARGLDHMGLARDHQIVFTLADLRLAFKRPARLDDRLVVVTTALEPGRVRMVFKQEIWRDDSCLIQGEFTVACVNITTFRPARLPLVMTEER